MKTEIINIILEEVKIKLNEIFGDQMLFGFVCGGFSKGYADENHDVDIVVCLSKESTKEMAEKYLQWYFDLHMRYGIKADYNHPGLVVTIKELLDTLEILKTLKLTLKIDDVKTMEAIIWADMIASQTAAETGSDLGLLRRLKSELQKYPEQWKQEVLSLITEEERNVWKDKSQLFIMERFMQYPKGSTRKP